MRINLNVPYAEKDQAKRLGALWDMARKVWYVEDLDNLRPFLKWMPAHLTRPATVLRGTEPAKVTDKPVAKIAKKARRGKAKKRGVCKPENSFRVSHQT